MLLIFCKLFGLFYYATIRYGCMGKKMQCKFAADEIRMKKFDINRF